MLLQFNIKAVIFLSQGKAKDAAFMFRLLPAVLNSTQWLFITFCFTGSSREKQWILYSWDWVWTSFPWTELNKVHQPDFRSEPFSQVRPCHKFLVCINQCSLTETRLCHAMYSHIAVSKQKVLYGPRSVSTVWITSFPYEKELFPQPWALAHQADTHTYSTLHGNRVHTYSSCCRTVLLHRKAVNDFCQAESFRAFWVPSSNFSHSNH